MDKPSEPPATAVPHDYTVENMQTLAEDMLNDPDLGWRSCVVSALSGDGRSPGGKPPDAATAAALEQMRYDFGYIIMSI